ncbi:MAG: hypothetical protein QUV04_07355 [Synechococcus sp. WH 8007]|nr:hypothetical protein [Synechococcus sp. WH 8007]
MPAMSWKKKLLNNEREATEQGFILPLVVIIGLIVGAGLMALSARTFASLIGSIRQGQSKEAREAAESGAAVVLRELNQNYPYLLIHDCEITSSSGTPFCPGWSNGDGGTFTYLTSVCPDTTNPPQTIFPKLSANLPGDRTNFRLIKYDFTGDQNQGGVARIQVEGHRLTTGTNQIVKATAFIDLEVNVIPKQCNGAQGGYPGLYGQTINLGNNDIEGSINGNVVCATCDPNESQDTLEDQIGLKTQGDVEGQIFGGQIPIDDPPPWPGFPLTYSQEDTTSDNDFNDFYTEASACTKADTDEANKIDGSITITAKSCNQGRCFTEANTTHCLISSISLNGKEELIVNTSAGPIIFYTDGDISIGGNTALIHNGTPVDLTIFGPPQSGSTYSQEINLGGGSQTTNLFIHMPNACMGINGGSADPTLYGSAWVRTYGGCPTASSNSKVGNIHIPDNMGSLVCTRFGINYCVGVREFSARGANRWSLTMKPL